MKNKGSNKLLTVMLIILVTITLIGVVIFVLLTLFNKPAASGEPTIDDILAYSVDVPEITTNLADNNFVRFSLKITTDSKEAAAELTKRDFQTKNLLIEELSELTEEDLQGKQGKIILQSTVKSKLNELMQDGEIVDVYITSYIIQ
ncbi:MAG TPA: flagellar basal body-associated protein FliL [Ureibacillus sp.]|nr:flagellar basal body-associated protein FliL [Ureibacillus sp.]